MVEVFLILIIFILLIAVFLLFKRVSSLESELSSIKFQKTSQSVKYGQLTEQWIPFSERFPFNPEDFHFLGQPIDGIVFDDNIIAFVEFKTASSQLNQKQRNIKNLVEKKKIKWLEFRIR